LALFVDLVSELATRNSLGHEVRARSGRQITPALSWIMCYGKLS